MSEIHPKQERRTPSVKKNAGKVASARSLKARSHSSVDEFHKTHELQGRLRANVHELEETVWRLEENLAEARRSVETVREKRKQSGRDSKP